MARTDASGQSLEFSDATKTRAYQRNYDTPPRGCVGYWCEWCYFSSMSTGYFQVDHLVSVARREEFGLTIEQLRSIDNAVILCSACNASKNKHDYPRYGVGLAYRLPSQNMTHGGLRQVQLDWDDLVLMAQRKGRFASRG